MLETDWKTQADALLLAIDPASAEPKYTHDFADPVAADLGASPAGVCLGCTGPLLDLRLRPALKAADLWRGRGFAALIDASGIERRYAASGLPEADARSLIVGTALHEYCHHVMAGPPVPEGQADLLISRSAVARDFLAEPIAAGLDKRGGEPWDRHDYRFGRAAIHAWHRASKAMPHLSLLPGEVWPSSMYWLAPIGDYVEALGDEMEGRSDEPLRSVLASPMPEAYQRFGEQDIERAAATLAAAREQVNPLEVV